MAIRTARHRTRNARYAARQAGGSRLVVRLARAGFVARGVMYAVIGVLALEIAFGESGHRADQSGAIRVVAGTPFGAALLWLLAVGFTGMALWRLSQAAYGAPGPGGRKPAIRLVALAKAMLYGFFVFVIVRYALGLGAPVSSNRQAADLTTTAMRHPGGRVAVGLAGLILLGLGAYLAYNAFERRFLADLRLGEMRPPVRRAVIVCGRAGGVARGIVFGAVGVWLLVAAVTAHAHKAKGLDAALRSFARTPAGPWLLVVIAAGLVTFGLYSLAEARWRRL